MYLPLPDWQSAMCNEPGAMVALLDEGKRSLRLGGRSRRAQFGKQVIHRKFNDCFFLVGQDLTLGKFRLNLFTGNNQSSNLLTKIGQGHLQYWKNLRQECYAKEAGEALIFCQIVNSQTAPAEIGSNVNP